MARFFGTLRNLSRPGTVSRLGHKSGGVRTTVETWHHVFTMMVYHRNGIDRVRISYGPKGGSYIITLIDCPVYDLAVEWADRHRVSLVKQINAESERSPESVL